MQLGSVVQSSLGLEYVQELSVGSFGALWLARLTTGPELGRLVVARRIKLDGLDATKIEKILTAAHLYGGISHPSLVKLLGVSRMQNELVWVEEQVIGVPLSKVYEFVRAQGTSVPTDIATKLVLDVVRASMALRKACRDQSLPVPEQIVFPDSITVANFGEALLAGLGVSNEISRCAGVRRHQDLADVLDPLVPVGPNNECREVFTVGATLWKLLVIRGLFDDYGNQQTLDLVLHSPSLKPEYAERLNLCVPKPIAQIIRRATERDLKIRFQSLQELAVALDRLPAQYLAADSKIREWLSDVAGDYLSDVQRSSGVRRVPFKLRAPLPSSDFGGRPSYIPTPLPGFHEPFVPKPPSDTIPSIIAPASLETPADQMPVAPVVSDLSAIPSKRHPRFRLGLVTLVLLIAGGTGYCLTHRARVHDFAEQLYHRVLHLRLQSMPKAADQASTQSNAVSTDDKPSRDAAGDLAQTAVSVGQETITGGPSNTTKNASHSKHKAIGAKPNAPPPAPSPNDSNRWGI